MCKVKQLNGEAPRMNGYCTAREYEVFTIIAKNDNYKVGDMIDGEMLSNKTKNRIWEITECNRVDGGHVSIKDNLGTEKTCIFVFGKGTQKTKPTPKPQEVAPAEEVTHTPAETVQEIATVQAAPATPVNDDISQFTNFLGGMQKNAYDKGYLKGIEVANSEKQRIIDELKAENETLKNQPQVKGTVINLTIEGKTTTKVIQAIVNPNAEEILDYLKEGENVFLWGPAGAGKNVLGEQLADMLNVDFYYMNTVYTKYDITGFTDAQGNYIPTAVINWLRSTTGGLLFLDEICTNAPEANTAINALLANKYIVLQNGEVLKMTSRHYVVAADNTNGLGATEEYNGRYKMDESTRDRFAFFFIDYDAAVEESIVGDKKDILSFIYDLRRITKDCNISLILGYRCITRLVKFYSRDAVRTIDHNITKGMEQDTINEIASRLDGTTKWHKAFKSLAK